MTYAAKWKLSLVTGMFSSTDVIASLAEPLAMVLFPVDPWTFVASEPGIRSDSEKMLLILLGEHHDDASAARPRELPRAA